MYLEAKMAGKRILSIPLPEVHGTLVDELMYNFKDKVHTDLIIEKIGED